jgi:seryl-tRNA synthetase
MDINSTLFEVTSIDTELQRLRKKVVELNKRKKLLADKIIEHLKETDETEVSYQGKVYRLTEKIKHSRKSTQKQRESILSVLSEEDIHGDDAKELCDRLLNDALRGSESVTYTLKV